jgi:hypothetical protein
MVELYPKLLKNQLKLILNWLSPLAYIPHLTVGGGLTLDSDKV